MNTSPSMINIMPALLEAQKGITFAVKSAINPFFRSSYANLIDVIDAVKPSLNANGIVYIQTVDPSDQTSLTITTRLMHVSGEWIEGIAIMPLIKSDPQSYGSAISYLRRYALGAICGLYADDDDANEASKPAQLKAKAQKEDTKTSIGEFHTKETSDILYYANKDDIEEALRVFEDIEDSDKRVAVWGELKPYSKIRSALKKLADEQKEAVKLIDKQQNNPL